jgi:hypothetical protein
MRWGGGLVVATATFALVATLASCGSFSSAPDFADDGGSETTDGGGPADGDTTADATADGAHVDIDGASWSPSVLGSAVVLWLDGDSNVALAFATSKVAQWGDKSGRDNSAVQSYEVLQPVVSGTSINGHKALRFVECNQLVVPDKLSLQTGSTGFTLGVVLRAGPAATAGGDIFGKQINVAPYDGIFLSMSAEGSFAAYVSSSQSVTGPSGFDTNVHAVVLRYSTSSLSLRRDGAELVTATVGSTNVSAAGYPVKIGASGSGTSECFDGEIAEIVLANKALDGAETSSLEAYFKGKYGL